MRMAHPREAGAHERAAGATSSVSITEVVEHDALVDRLRELAAMVNRNAPLAVRGTRLAIRKGLGLPLYEAELIAEAFRERVLHTDDSNEGPRAFLEHRDPEWRCE